MTDNENEMYEVHPDLADNVPVQVKKERPVHMSVVSDEPEQIEERPIIEPQTISPLPAPREDHPNFRSLREKAERADRERERERDRADRLEAELRRTLQPKEHVQQDEHLGDDDYVTAKHVSKVKREYQEENQKLRQELTQSKQRVSDSILRLEYPDIKKVMTVDNVQRLVDQEPELALGLDNIPDYETKVQATYKAIKRLGIFVEDNYEKDRARVQANAAKPKSLNSIAPQQGESPLARANVFANTDDSEAANIKRYEDMMKYAGNRE